MNWYITIPVIILTILGFYFRQEIVITYLNITKQTSFVVDEEDESILHMEGEINALSFRQLKKVYKNNPGIKTIQMGDVPGSLSDETNLKMCHWVREQGLNTYLTSESIVASGGTDFFLAGVERTMEQGAKIGVHSWSDGKREGKDFPKDHEEHKKYTVYTKAMLGSDEFYWFTIYAAPADDIYFMTLEEIKQFNLATSIQ